MNNINVEGSYDTNGTCGGVIAFIGSGVSTTLTNATVNIHIASSDLSTGLIYG